MKPASAGSFWRQGTDLDYSSSSRSGIPAAWAADFASIQALPPEESRQRAAGLRRILQVMPSGVRIRNLRAVLGWTQRMAAVELGISVRTVIRHEQGRNRRRWLRLPLLRKLRDLESLYAEELIAYLRRVGPEHA